MQRKNTFNTVFKAADSGWKAETLNQSELMKDTICYLCLNYSNHVEM